MNRAVDQKSLPVVILAGGRGTRLREETEFRPKPMVEIGGYPILWHIMRYYAHFGHSRFVVCLGHKGEVIKNYFLNYSALRGDFTLHLGSHQQITYHKDVEDDWRVTLADTGDSAMTGARLSRVRCYLDGPNFLLTYGDGLADVDLQALVAFHKEHGRIATVTGVRPASRFGELITDGQNRVLEFSEKPRVGSGWVNGGFFVFREEVFDYLSTDDSCVLELAPLERLAGDGQLMVWPHQGYWQCMDTPRDLELLQEIWRSGRAPWRAWAP